MRRTVLLLVSLALAVAGLAGCSGGDDEYCGLLEEAKQDKTLQNAQLADPDAMQAAKSTFEEVSSAAPDELEDEWKTMSEMLELAEKYQQDPKSVDPASVQDLTKQVQADTKTLEDDAKERCGIDL